MSLPFFSIVIPLYNKEKYIRNTIKSVLNQTFQDFEIVVVNDGSKDGSVEVIRAIKDIRVRLFEQENAGVSVARNKGIKESKSEYIVFLDADDLWLPEFLQTIYDLILKFPDAGLYATAYKKRKSNGEEYGINIQGLPSNKHSCIIPNYFESIIKGDFVVWTSATCIPKKVFIDNNIWFPAGEKYGEDQYVWARVAMEYMIAYDTKPHAIYQIEAENNTTKAILKEKEPHKSILMLKNYRSNIKDRKKLKYFDIFVERHIKSFILDNIVNDKKIYALKQLFSYQLSIGMKIKLIIIICIPSFMYVYLQKIKKIIPGKGI